MKQMQDIKAEIVPLIRDVCMALTGRANENEVALMLGTAAAESSLVDRVQKEDGPACGLWQMEPGMTGAQDIFLNYLNRKPFTFRSVAAMWLELSSLSCFIPHEEELAYHLENYDDFGCLMARLKYWRDPDPIPYTLEGQAAYWLRVYNGGGKGTVEHYLSQWAACGCEELLRR